MWDLAEKRWHTRTHQKRLDTTGEKHDSMMSFDLAIIFDGGSYEGELGMNLSWIIPRTPIDPMILLEILADCHGNHDRIFLFICFE